MNYLIDAYAWIEYLEGSTAGSKVRKIIEENEAITLSITLAEVISKVKRKGLDENNAYQAITSNSIISDVTADVARSAGIFHAEIRKKVPNFGLVDSLLLAGARSKKIKVVTGDHHFKGFKETLFIG